MRTTEHAEKLTISTGATALTCQLHAALVMIILCRCYSYFLPVKHTRVLLVVSHLVMLVTPTSVVSANSFRDSKKYVHPDSLYICQCYDNLNKCYRLSLECQTGDMAT